MKKFKKNRKGFTLVELIVVIAILAILAGVAIPVYSGYIAKANEAADLAALDAVKTAAVFAYTEKQVKEGQNTEVTKIVYNASANTVDITGKETDDAETGLSISTYTDPVTFQSTAYKTAGKATWTVNSTTGAGEWKAGE